MNNTGFMEKKKEFKETTENLCTFVANKQTKTYLNNNKILKMKKRKQENPQTNKNIYNTH